MTFDNWIFNIPEDKWKRWCNDGYASVAAEAWKAAQQAMTPQPKPVAALLKKDSHDHSRSTS